MASAAIVPARSAFVPTYPARVPHRRRLASSRFTAPVTRPPPRRARLHALPVYASVQQQTAWNPVKVLENAPICEDHRYLAISVGTTDATGSLADAYRTPGMFVQLRPDDATKPGFFAISCAPNIQGVFEFLVKETPSVEWLAACGPGDVVLMSPVQGDGFPVERLDMVSFPPIPEEDVPRDILLFATGSGIAPIRAAIESPLNGLRIPQRRSVKLFYGARYPERMAYMDRFKMWEQDGVEVVPVMSQPQLGTGEWRGRVGYVQGALKDVGVDHPRQTGALLCGVRGMTDDVTKMLVEAGVPKERILMNF